MSAITDTSPDVERRIRETLRAMPFHERWERMGSIYHTGRILFAAGVRDRNPAATDEDIQAEWDAACLGPDVLLPRRRFDVSNSTEELRVVQEVVGVLTSMNIAYALGGSWASSMMGRMRFTFDADMAVEPFPGREVEFCARFGSSYYLSLPAVQDAVRRRSTFNVLFAPLSFKVDCFVRKDRPFEISAMARRQPRSLPQDPAQSIMCVTPEDLILFKLEWYRLGNETSEHQWKDVRGVFETQGGSLDQAYLDRWAADLGVSDLLQRVRRESAI
jgi:hypothetical protein